MKKATLLIVLIHVCTFAQVGINTTTPDASAALDIVSTNSGLLVPRMTETQRLDINNPSNGLLVYQTNNEVGYWYYKTNTWSYLSKEGDDDWAGAGKNDIAGDLYKYGKIEIRPTAGIAAITIGENTTEPVSNGVIAIGPYTALTNTSKFVIGKERVATAFDSTYVCGVGGCSWHVFATQWSNKNAFEISQSGAVTINSRYTLPLGDGNAGDILTTDGNGVLSWTNPTTNPFSNANSQENNSSNIQTEIERTLKKYQYTDQILLSKDDGDLLGIRHKNFITLLIKAIREQQQLIKSQEVSIEDLNKRVEKLEQLLKEKIK